MERKIAPVMSLVYGRVFTSFSSLFNLDPVPIESHRQSYTHLSHKWHDCFLITYNSVRTPPPSLSQEKREYFVLDDKDGQPCLRFENIIIHANN